MSMTRAKTLAQRGDKDRELEAAMDAATRAENPDLRPFARLVTPMIKGQVDWIMSRSSLQDKEDAAQEVAIYLWKKLPKLSQIYDGQRSLSALLRKVIERRIKLRAKRFMTSTWAKVNNLVFGESLEDIYAKLPVIALERIRDTNPEADPEAVLLEEQMLAQLKKRLSVEEYELLILTGVNERSLDEVATILGISKKTLYKRCSRLREKMNSIFARLQILTALLFFALMLNAADSRVGWNEGRMDRSDLNAFIINH